MSQVRNRCCYLYALFDLSSSLIVSSDQKLNCHESDVRMAIQNHDPHDQLKIAYDLILDSKRMRLLGKDRKSE